MAFQGFLRQSTAVDVLIGPFLDDTDGKTAETGLTISQADVKLSKNGQALAQKNDVTAAAHDANGYYNCELDATDTNTVGQLTIIVHESGALPVRLDYHIVEEAVYDAMYAGSAAGPLQSTTAGRTLDIQATGEVDANLTMMGGVAQSATDLKDLADTGYDPSTHRIRANLEEILGHLLMQTGTQLADGFEHFFDVATPAITVAVAMRGTDSANTTKTGYTLTNLSDANAAKLEDMLDGTGATLSLSNNLEVDLTKIHGSALTETAGQLAGRFVDFFDQDSAGYNVKTALSSFKATGFSTHNAAAVKTAMEADGGKLDHLWEMTEDDGGVQRLTQNALEQAPSGSGGDATAANQTTIITHLTGVKGTTFNTATDSLEAIRNRGDAAWVTGGTGGGAVEWVVTVDDGSNPLDGVVVWVTTDEAGTNTIASGTTDSLGQVTFMLDAGDYYCWKQLAGYSFTNPEAMTVA